MSTAAAARIGVALLIGVLAIFGARLAAHAQTFTGDVGLVTYTVPADREAVFEQVLDRVTQALRRPDTPERPRPPVAMRWLKTVGARPGAASYVLLVDPVLPGIDYGLETLIAQLLPDAAAQLGAQLRFATAGAAPVASSYRALHVVTPVDALRARLEVGLADQLRGVSAPPGAAASPATLERLQQPLWAVDNLQYRLAPSSDGAQVVWNGEVRNLSPVLPLAGDLVVELRDSSGAVLETLRRPLLELAPQATRTESGTMSLPTEAAARVTSASLRIEPRP